MTQNTRSEVANAHPFRAPRSAKLRGTIGANARHAARENARTACRKRLGVLPIRDYITMTAM